MIVIRNIISSNPDSYWDIGPVETQIQNSLEQITEIFLKGFTKLKRIINLRPDPVQFSKGMDLF